MKKTFVLGVIYIFYINTSLVKSQCDCLDAYKGNMTKITKTDWSQKTSKEISDYFEDGTFLSDFHNNNWGGNISIPSKTGNINLSASGDKTKNTTSWNNTIKSLNSTEKTELYLSLLNILPDKDMAQKFNECNSNCGTGFRCQITDNGDDVTFAISYQTYYATDFPVVQYFNVSNSTDITNGFSPDQQINNPQVVVVKRDKTKPITLILQTNKESLIKVVPPIENAIQQQTCVDPGPTPINSSCVEISLNAQANRSYSITANYNYASYENCEASQTKKFALNLVKLTALNTKTGDETIIAEQKYDNDNYNWISTNLGDNINGKLLGVFTPNTSDIFVVKLTINCVQECNGVRNFTTTYSSNNCIEIK